MAAGCGTKLPSIPQQPVVTVLAPAESGRVAEVGQVVGKKLKTGESGLMLLSKSSDALLWRLALVDAAESSIDVKYFIWQDDPTGALMFSRLLTAADRGVRVRLLLDDLTRLPSDRNVSELCLHPHFDIKIYNPIGVRGGTVSSGSEFVLGLPKYNRRMHNKMLLVDSRMGIMGGRNIGDDYFGTSHKFNFRDLDVMVAGSVVASLGEGFDIYWNSPASYPGSYLSKKATEKGLQKQRQKIERLVEKGAPSLESFTVDQDEVARVFSTLPARMVPGRAQVVQDEPIEVGGKSVRVIELLDYLFSPDGKELLVSSPYMIPMGRMLQRIKAATDGGLRIKLMTGSLGSNNHTSAHGHYQKYRKTILEAGAELYEFRHDPALDILELANTPPVEADFIALHMKAFVLDRKQCYIGSLNLDPRAVDINTENGLFIESEELCGLLADEIERMMSPDNSWQVLWDEEAKALRWKSSRSLRRSQPARTTWSRFTAWFFGMMPIRKQL